MKPQHLISIVIGLIVAAIYVENFYEHPTLGNGLRAFFAAASLGRLG
jgi:hypothetical protein